MKKQPAFVFFSKNKIQNFKHKFFRSFAKRKTRWILQQRQILQNGQTHKKASKNQGDLRFLRILSFELLQRPNENQARHTKLLEISPKT